MCFMTVCESVSRRPIGFSNRQRATEGGSMEILQPLNIPIPSPYSPDSTELFDWELFLRTAFRRVNDMKVMGRTFIVNANGYDTLNDAIAEAQNLNGVVYLPKGNYVWNAATYNSDVVLWGEGATVTVTGTILFSGSSSFYAEDVQFVANGNYNVFSVTNRTTPRQGVVFLKDCSITYNATSFTVYPVVLKDFREIIFSGVSLNITSTGSGSVRSIETQSDVLYWDRVTISQPVFNSPLGYRIFTKNGYITRSRFINQRAFLQPDVDSDGNYYVSDSYFESNYSAVSPLLAQVFVNIAPPYHCTASFNKCVFRNTSTQKDAFFAHIIPDSPKSLVVQQCSFENGIGVRFTGNTFFNDRIPSAVVAKNVFRNCYRMAIEVLFFGHLLIADNLIYVDTDFEGGDMTADGYGIAMRLRVFPTPLNNTITNSNQNPVRWVIANNVVMNYFRSGIQVQMDNITDPNRRCYTNIYIFNNTVDGINYTNLWNTNKATFESTYAATTYHRGSGIHIFQPNGVATDWVTLFLEGNKILNCYHGIYIDHIKTGQLGDVITKLLIRDTTIPKSNIAFYSSIYFNTSPTDMLILDGYNGIFSLLGTGNAKVWLNDAFLEDVNISVGSSSYVVFNDVRIFRLTEGSLPTLPTYVYGDYNIVSESTFRVSVFLRSGFERGLRLMKHEVALRSPTGAAPTQLTINGIQYAAFPIDNNQYAYGLLGYSATQANLHKSYAPTRFVLFIVNNSASNVTVYVDHNTFGGNTWTQLSSVNVNANQIDTFIISATAYPTSRGTMLRVRSNATTTGQVFVVGLMVYYSEVVS